MTIPTPILKRFNLVSLRLAYASVLVLFALIASRFYVPGKGFTYLVMFGQVDNTRYIPELKAINHYEIAGSIGYDGLYYAQIAMHPRLSDGAMRGAIDNLPYRARRILFCWTAYALALGNPTRALDIYAVQNIFCWFGLAVLMLRWFPPIRWNNFLRWIGVLFSFGLCFSVRAALLDGPSLLLIATACALAEKGRTWWSALLFGVSGLGKETNILSGAALMPLSHSASRLRFVVRIGAVVVLPLVIWIVALRLRLGENTAFDGANLALPFTGYIGKWREVVFTVNEQGLSKAAFGNLLLLGVVTIQFLFFALRPRWSELYWRVGAAYATLMVFLGEAVWEGYPSAAARVLLPMALAFNILVPAGRLWFIVLLLGNLTFLAAPDMLRPPADECYKVTGPRVLRIAEQTHNTVEVIFDNNWYGPERSAFERWNWSKGPATATLRNPHPFPVIADVSFGVRTVQSREIALRTEDRELWRETLGGTKATQVVLRNVRLKPGDTVWYFETDVPGRQQRTDDPRQIAFSLRNLEIHLIQRMNP